MRTASGIATAIVATTVRISHSIDTQTELRKRGSSNKGAEVGEADIDAVGIAELSVLQGDVDGVDRRHESQNREDRHGRHGEDDRQTRADFHGRWGEPL